MKRKAALFDLDGVVFDTEPQYTVFWGKVCRRYHPEIPGLEQRIKGQTLVQIFEAHFTDTQQQRQIVADLDEYERSMHYDYVKGAAEFVGQLKKLGLKTAIVTSSNRVKMEAVYKAHPEVLTLFDAILTSEDFTESKPSPQCYLRAAEKFNVAPGECVVFEDSINGLRAAKAAGTWVVGLTTTNTAGDIDMMCQRVAADFTDPRLLDDCLE